MACDAGIHHVAGGGGQIAPPRRRAAGTRERPAERRRGGFDAVARCGDRDEVHPLLDGHHAVGDGAGAFLLAHRRARGEVGGRLLDRHLVDTQVGVGDAAEAVEGGSALDHRLHGARGLARRAVGEGHRRGSVPSGEDRDARMAEARRTAPLPGRQPGGGFAQRAEAAGAAGMAPLRRERRGPRLQVRCGQLRKNFPDLIQACSVLVHGHATPPSVRLTVVGLSYNQAGVPATAADSVMPEPRRSSAARACRSGRGCHEFDLTGG